MNTNIIDLLQTDVNSISNPNLLTFAENLQHALNDCYSKLYNERLTHSLVQDNLDKRNAWIEDYQTQLNTQSEEIEELTSERDALKELVDAWRASPDTTPNVQSTIPPDRRILAIDHTKLDEKTHEAFIFQLMDIATRYFNKEKTIAAFEAQAVEAEKDKNRLQTRLDACKKRLEHMQQNPNHLLLGYIPTEALQDLPNINHYTIITPVEHASIAEDESCPFTPVYILTDTDKPDEKGSNEYGLDMGYFRKAINRDLCCPLTNYKPNELARIFARLAKTADPSVLAEPEFQLQQLHKYQEFFTQFDDMCATLHLAADLNDPNKSINELINWYIIIERDPDVNPQHPWNVISTILKEMIDEAVTVDMKEYLTTFQNRIYNELFDKESEQ